MQVAVSDEAPEPAALTLARQWIDPAGVEPARATIKQLATEMGIDTDVVRGRLRDLVQSGIVVVRRRACCAPESDLCHPDQLQDNEHFELTPGWAYRREVRTPRAVPALPPPPD
jgi:hypothetical protein